MDTFHAEKDTDNSLKKSNTINADSYTDSIYQKSQIVRFKNEILQSLQGDIKKRFDSEFKFFKSRCEELRSKQEELRPKDEIINRALVLLGN